MVKTCALIALASSAGFCGAFLSPTPSSRPIPCRTSSQQVHALSQNELYSIGQNLIAITKENDVFTKNQGEYPWGSVQAPGWALPVAAIAMLSIGVLLPLVLSPGVDAFNAGGVKGVDTKTRKGVGTTKAELQKGTQKAASNIKAGKSNVKAAGAKLGQQAKKKGLF